MKANNNQKTKLHAVIRLVTVLFLILTLSGCAGTKRDIVKIPEPLEAPVIGNSTPSSPGSLWTDRGGSWISDLRARAVGDIVTVIIKEKASASKKSTTQTDRRSSITAGIPILFGIEQKIVESFPRINPANLIRADFTNDFQGSGHTMRREDLVATLTTQVIKIFPNGNMQIRGGKSIIVNNENQIIYLTGIIRPWDVSAANEVDSSRILNAQIAYTGKGIISDKQRPGWLTRIIDNVWPL